MRRLLLTLTVTVTLLSCTTAGAATVSLGARTFDQACAAAAAGDVVTVPAGSYGQQSVTCTKPVTFQGAGPATLLSYLTIRGAGTTVAGMRSTGGADIEAASGVTLEDMTFNNQVYLERNDGIVFDHSTWEPSSPGAVTRDGDYLDIFPASSGSSTQPNRNITVQDSVFTGLRSPSSTAHSDAIQLYNEGPPHTNIKILRTRFSNNECINIRMNDQDQVLLENNVFGDSVTGISGCGYYSLDVSSARVTARYNTFPGSQQIQGTSTSAPASAMTWTGNAGIGFNNGCAGAGRSGAGAFARNVWTQMKCGATDRQVPALLLNGDGSPQVGSPVIDAGDPSVFPAVDLIGTARPRGAFADAGAFESGTITTPPPPPADRDGDGVPDGTDACPDVAGSQPDGCNPAPPPPSCADQVAGLQTVIDQLRTDLAAANGRVADTETALTQSQADLAAMTDSRDAWKTRAQKAEDQVARIKTIAVE